MRDNIARHFHCGRRIGYGLGVWLCAVCTVGCVGGVGSEGGVWVMGTVGVCACVFRGGGGGGGGGGCMYMHLGVVGGLVGES